MDRNVVLISGCSSGIGKNLACRLSKKGYTVVATARDPNAIADLPVALKLRMDVTDQDSVDAAVAETIDRFGKIDALVNNAGHSVRSAVEEIDEEKARRMFDVNLWGLIRASRAVLPGMRERGEGRIIHVGSVVGKFTWPCNGAYSASKYAVEAIADAMRLELLPFGVAVTLVQPGTIDSNFMKASEEKSSDRFRNDDSPYSGIYRSFATKAADPAHRGASPDRVTDVIVKALEARRPKARYLAAVSPLYRAILRMGDGTRDWAFAKTFGIKQPRRR